MKRLPYAYVVAMLSPRNLIPPHGVRDRAKLLALVADLEERGWTGRPLLAVEVGEGGPIVLLTGSHRVAAAKAAGLDEIPVLVLEIEDLGWDVGRRFELLDDDGNPLTDDEDRLRALRRAGEVEALALMEQEIGQ